MPYKDQQKQKEVQTKHYSKYAKAVRKRRKLNRQIVNKIKSELYCKYCGESSLCCLDFHHNNPNTKTTTVSRATREFGEKRLREEISKCDVLCSNCHTKNHKSKTHNGEQWIGFNNARIKKREWFINYISQQRCSQCNESNTKCLEHHHIKPKRFNISYLLTSGHSIDYLKSEIARCIVVCRNCHRKIHCGSVC